MWLGASVLWLLKTITIIGYWIFKERIHTNFEAVSLAHTKQSLKNGSYYRYYLWLEAHWYLSGHQWKPWCSSFLGAFCPSSFVYRGPNLVAPQYPPRVQQTKGENLTWPDLTWVLDMSSHLEKSCESSYRGFRSLGLSGQGLGHRGYCLPSPRFPKHEHF